MIKESGQLFMITQGFTSVLKQTAAARIVSFLGMVVTCAHARHGVPDVGWSNDDDDDDEGGGRGEQRKQKPVLRDFRQDGELGAHVLLSSGKII